MHDFRRRTKPKHVEWHIRGGGMRHMYDIIWLEYKIDSYNDYVKLEIQGMQARGDAMDAENVLTNMLMSYLVVEDQVFIQSTWIGNKITSMIGSS